MYTNGILVYIVEKEQPAKEYSKSDEKKKKTGSLGFSCILKNINNRLVLIHI